MPGTLPGLFARDAATTRATGLRARPEVMITSSPCRARSTKLERFVFASCMVAVCMVAWEILARLILANLEAPGNTKDGKSRLPGLF